MEVVETRVKKFVPNAKGKAILDKIFAAIPSNNVHMKKQAYFIIQLSPLPEALRSSMQGVSGSF